MIWTIFKKPGSSLNCCFSTFMGTFWRNRRRKLSDAVANHHASYSICLWLFRWLRRISTLWGSSPAPPTARHPQPKYRSARQGWVADFLTILAQWLGNRPRFWAKSILFLLKGLVQTEVLLFRFRSFWSCLHYNSEGKSLLSVLRYEILDPKIALFFDSQQTYI